MKRPYTIPETQTIQFGTCKMMAESQPNVTAKPNAAAVSGSDLDVKENKNVWDEEW